MPRLMENIAIVALSLSLASCSTDSADEPVASPSAIPSSTSVMELTNHEITDSWQIVESETSLLTEPIKGGRGFHMKLNDGYRVYSAHLVDANGNLVCPNYLYPDTWNAATRCDWTDERRSEYGSDMIPASLAVRLVIKRADGGAISPVDKVIKSFIYLDHSGLIRLSAQTEGYAAVKKRLDALTQLMWTPLAHVQAARSTVGANHQEYYFQAGKTYLGPPYSENDEYSKYVGQHVSLYTFLTALHNRRSVMYTEDISITHPRSAYGIAYHGLNDTYCAAYYGSVCSGLTGYVMGLDNVYLSTLYSDGTLARRLGMDNYIEVSPDDVKPLDLIWNKGHISMVSDVIVDKHGTRFFIVWAEQSKPGSYLTPYTPERFAARINQVGARIFRWNGWTKPTYASTPWMDEDIDNIVYNEHISTMYGDKPSVTLGDTFFLNLNRGVGYTTLEVFDQNDDAMPLRIIDISDSRSYPADGFGGDWVAFDANALGLPAGKYKARLVSDWQVSDWVCWEWIGINMHLVASGSSITVTFDCRGGEPYVLRGERADGISTGTHIISKTDLSRGRATVSIGRGSCVKLYVRGDYGVSIKRVFLQ